jgi:uncharacterized membrane protein YdfJ with MMPL/SSD domain
VFKRVARICITHRWIVLGLWLVLVAASAPFALTAQESLKVGGFSSEETEAARARVVVQDQLGYSPSTMIVIYESDTLAASSPAFLAQVDASLTTVRELPFVR